MSNNSVLVYKLFKVQFGILVLISLAIFYSINTFSNQPPGLAISQIEKMIDDSNKVNYLLNECETYPIASSKKNRELIDLLLETSTLIHHDRARTQAYIYLSDYFYAIENNDSALVFIRTSKRSSKDYGISSFLFEIYLKEAIIHKARFDVAGEKESLKRAVLFSVEKGNQGQIAQAYQLTGEFSLRLHQYYKAIVYLKKAINLFTIEKEKLNLLHAHSTLSDAYIERKEFHLAFKTLKEVIPIISKSPIQDSLRGHMYANLGLVNYYLKKNEESLTYFETAEKTMPLSSQCLVIYNYLFLIHNQNNNLIKQIEYLDKLSVINNSAFSETDRLLAKNKKMYFDSIGKCDSAIVYLKQSSKIDKAQNGHQLSKSIEVLKFQQEIEYIRATKNIEALESQFKITKNETSILLAFTSFIALLSIAISKAYPNLIPKQYIQFSYYLLLLTLSINIAIQLLA